MLRLCEQESGRNKGLEEFLLAHKDVIYHVWFMTSYPVWVWPVLNGIHVEKGLKQKKKPKVVASFWGTELIQFRAVLANLH